MQKYLEARVGELQRTRAFCSRLIELELLQDMRFDATLPDGNTLTVDGFLALDEKKLAALPDAVVVELQHAPARRAPAATQGERLSALVRSPHVVPRRRG